MQRVRELPELLQPRAVSDEPDLFPKARDAYLAGEWSEAETILLRVLAIEPRDPPALLLLSSVYRHTDRAEQAKCLIKEMSLLEVADSWYLEIEAESKKIQRQLEASANQQSKDETDQERADLTAA